MTFFGDIGVFLVISVWFGYANAKPGRFYCDFGFCESEQYCCGDNKCCDKLLDLWYFWLGIGIIIVVVSGIIFLRYFLAKKKSQSYKYKLLEQS